MGRFGTIIMLAIILVSGLTSCDKTSLEEQENNEFCKLMNDQDYESLKPVVSTYFEKQSGRDSVENIVLLVKWLQEKPCISNAEIGTIYTSSPPIYKINVVHKTDTSKNFFVYARQVSPLVLLALGK